MGIDQETLDRLKAEHDEVHTLEGGGYTIAVKPPSEAAFDRFMSMSARNKDAPHKALAALVIDCLVHPPIKEYKDIVSKRPGLVVAFGTECARIGGLVEEVERKKA